MTEPTAPTSENPRASRAIRIAWGMLVCATLYVCYFSQLGALGFIGPDEPRYAWIARDMMETGDWITPRLYGRPWFEKPPLFYWAAGLCFKCFGVSEAAARLPSAISALLATLVLAWLALRVYGAQTARWLLLLLPTTVGMIGFSHAAATDMPFSAMLTIALVCAAVVLGLTRDENAQILGNTPWLAMILFGIFLGLAGLAKGPVAIVLSGGALFFWALITKRWRDAFRLLHPAAIAAFCATALPWYVLCARRNPDFLRAFIIEHNFKRYLTPEFQHVQPFWFYLPVLLVAFLPWTALFLWGAAQGTIHLWRTRWTKESTWLLICWAGFCLVFFSISQSKLPGYILPAVPAIALLISHLCQSQAAPHRKSFRLALLSAAMLLVVLRAIIAAMTPHVLGGHERIAVVGGAVLGLMAAANLLLAIFSQGDHNSILRFSRAVTAVLPILLAVFLSKSLITSYFYWDPSGRTIARELQRRLVPLDQLAVTNMSRGMEYSLNFYLHREVKVWDRDHPTEGYLLTGGQTCGASITSSITCEQLPFDTRTTGRFLYQVKIPGSAQAASNGGRQVQKKE